MLECLSVRLTERRSLSQSLTSRESGQCARLSVDRLEIEIEIEIDLP